MEYEIIKHSKTDSNVFLLDCVKGMKQYPDNYFDLAVVDPPYGINICKTGKVGGGVLAKVNKYTVKNWDNEPCNKDYFIELKRVSKNQIIWGANHFIENIPNANTPSWIVWDKLNGDTDFADCELAYTSFKKTVRKFQFQWHGMLQGDMKNKEIKIHPTQKPVKLYDWIFNNYATEGMKILDTHLGSQSSRIAAKKSNLDFTGFETDLEYFEKGNKRFEDFISQITLF